MKKIRPVFLGMTILIFLSACRTSEQCQDSQEFHHNYDAVLEYFLPSEIAQRKENTLIVDAYATFAHTTSGTVYLYYQYKLIDQTTLQNPEIVRNEGLPVIITFNGDGEIESYKMPAKDETIIEFTNTNFPTDLQERSPEFINERSITEAEINEKIANLE